MWVRGNDVSALTKEQIPYYRRQFGIMQSDLGLLKERTARQNIELAMRATEQPEHTMRALGIYERAEHYPRELSGGEAARVLLARALVTDPKILVLDEPTANLDSSAAWDLMCLIDEINRKGITVLVASHNRELVTIMKKRVVTLAAGVKVADEKNVIYSSTAGDIFDERRVLREREERRRKQRGR